MAEQPVLRVEGLRKRVRGRWLVDGVTFDVCPGEVFGFLGPNGAGKTTTIRMLVGLVKPTAGRVVIDGMDLAQQPLAALRQVGCIVENPDLYPYLTGYENLLLFAQMQGPQAVARIDTVARWLHLSERLHDKVGTYSLGMRQRLGIAQALLGAPKLLILDEPSNGLDPPGIRDLRHFLRQLASQGMAVLVSSHLLAEVELLCDRVAFIRDGRVVRSGTVQALLQETAGEVEWQVDPLATARSVLARFACGEVLPGRPGALLCPMAADAVPAAVAALAAAGCQVRAVAPRRLTLEDVFLATTGGGGSL
ncbi:MAG: ABC transporter ATP-binding protein [Alicyclobacillus sp.]|nr:ABC transporter ATP-binding protein [Alicyclobacillus sp.]